MNSIFDIESRIDLENEFDNMYYEFIRTHVDTAHLGGHTVFSLMDYVIRTWPFREGATSIDSYFSRKGIDIESSNKKSMLYQLELWYNLLNWAIKYDKSLDEPFHDPFEQFVDVDIYIQNIEYDLEKSNYKFRKVDTEKGCPKYYLTKRDCNVDVAVEANPDIAEVLLSYMDIRAEGDVVFKRSCLKQIADYLEPKRKTYKESSHCSYMETLFFAFNNFTIRHRNDKQIEMDNKKAELLYDKTFRLAISCLSFHEIDDIKAEIDKYRPH